MYGVTSVRIDVAPLAAAGHETVVGAVYVGDV